MPAYALRRRSHRRAEEGDHRGVVARRRPRAAARAGLLPLSVEAANERGRSFGSIKLPRLGRSGDQRPPLATVTRQIATLVGSDIAIEESLRLVATQSEQPQVSSLLLDVRGAILDGRSFAAALAQHPKAFPGILPRLGRGGRGIGPAARRAQPPRRIRREPPGQRPEAPACACSIRRCSPPVSFGMMVLLMVYVVPDIVRCSSRAAPTCRCSRGC
jgi:general secretion pathway protein F